MERQALESGFFTAGGGPLTSISCASARGCTAVGGYENEVGNAAANNFHEIYVSAVERWDGRSWALQSFPTPVGAIAALPFGISCTSVIACTAVGDAANLETVLYAPDFANQAVAGSWDGDTWSTRALGYPQGVYRSPDTQSPQTSLRAVACQTSASCATVGGYLASNGDIGPLAAFWNGSTWNQTVLRRGPVQLTSVSCPALGWCMTVGGGIAERFVG